jgi:hypothetical protein
MNTVSVILENKIPIRLGTIISIVVIFIGIGQYFVIRKIRQIRMI